MIEWFTWAQIGVAVIAGLCCLGLGLLGRQPNDYSLGATLFVELLLVGQLVAAIISPLAGNPPRGSLPEFYIYLISALLLPPLAGFWALLERNKWATVILGVICLAVAVMVFRMYQIWVFQVA